MENIALRRVATYERVSSEDQKQRETIKTQSDALAERLAHDPTVKLAARFIDDGVSGTIPMGKRPDGRRLLQAAKAHEFDELWVYNIKRLGREAVDLLMLIRQLEPLGIRLVSLQEGEQTGIVYDVGAVFADFDRRLFLKGSADGMNRAAKEGRYTGGIVPMGYVVEGRKQHARLVPSDKLIWGDWTESDLVRQIYRLLAIECWSCPRIAKHLNTLGVPTAYIKDGRLVRRGERKERTQGKWSAGRIRNLVKNPVYRGELHYGRRITKTNGRDVIVAEVPSLISGEIWEAAQNTLSGNPLMTKNTLRHYMLKSVIRCGNCGRAYIGSWSRNSVRYRCGGQLKDQGPISERCPAKAIKGTVIDDVVWDDTERFLRDPGDILEELNREKEMDAGAAIAEAERVTLESALIDLARRRKKAIDLNTRDRISDDELDGLLAEIIQEQDGAEKRLADLQPESIEPEEPLNPDLLEEVRWRLDELSDIQRQEVVRLLVKRIIVHTELTPNGKKARVLIEYGFPAVVDTSTDRGSWPPPA